MRDAGEEQRAYELLKCAAGELECIAQTRLGLGLPYAIVIAMPSGENFMVSNMHPDVTMEALAAIIAKHKERGIVRMEPSDELVRDEFEKLLRTHDDKW